MSFTRSVNVSLRRMPVPYSSLASNPVSPDINVKMACISSRVNTLGMRLVGRQLYSQRFGTVEPVFANIRHNKRLTRFNHRGRAKVNTQWNLYCMVHNIEKLAKTSMGRNRMMQ